MRRPREEPAIPTEVEYFLESETGGMYLDASLALENHQMQEQPTPAELFAFAARIDSSQEGTAEESRKAAHILATLALRDRIITTIRETISEGARIVGNEQERTDQLFCDRNRAIGQLLLHGRALTRWQTQSTDNRFSSYNNLLSFLTYEAFEEAMGKKDSLKTAHHLFSIANFFESRRLARS